jgi:hypothetical protein
MLPAVPLRFADDAAFLADLPYDPSVLFFDELSAVERDGDLLRCRMPTAQALPITSAQRTHPLRHPHHVAGAVMVHATGMLGFVHAYYVLGLRHHEGWIGYGTHIHRVVFRKLVQPGPSPIEATLTITKKRIGKARCFLRYGFEFRHEGQLCYEGDQSAMWLKVDEATSLRDLVGSGSGA